MIREDRLKEARDTLIASYESFWGSQKIPQKKVAMDLLLIDIIGHILGLEDSNRDTLINQSRFYSPEVEKKDEDQRQSVLDQLRDIISRNDLRVDETGEPDSPVPGSDQRVSSPRSRRNTVLPKQKRN